MTPEGEQRRSRSQCIPERLYAADVARMVLWLAADDSRLVYGARVRRGRGAGTDGLTFLPYGNLAWKKRSIC